MIPPISDLYTSPFEGLTFDSYDQFLRFMHTITEIYVTLYEEAREIEDAQLGNNFTVETVNRLEKVYARSRY